MGAHEKSNIPDLIKQLQLEFDQLLQENKHLSHAKENLKAVAPQPDLSAPLREIAAQPSSPVALPHEVPLPTLPPTALSYSKKEKKEGLSLKRAETLKELKDLATQFETEATEDSLAPLTKSRTSHHQLHDKAEHIREAGHSVTLKKRGSAFSLQETVPMKENVLKVLESAQDQRSEREVYKTSGLWIAAFRSPHFERLSLMMVALNSLWIWIDTDFNDAAELPAAHWPFQLIENLFVIYFLVEWVIQWMSFAEACLALRDAWFVFNSLLLIQMIFDSWVAYIMFAFLGDSGLLSGNLGALRMLRLMRMTRLFRMGRLMMVVPELMYMFKGLQKALRSALLTLTLLACFLYIFAITLRQLTTDTPSIGEKYFSSVPAALFSLAVHATLLDSVGLMLVEVYSESEVSACAVVIVILVGAFTILNMLIGVLCEMMSQVTADEKERMQVDFVRKQVLQAMESMDENGDKQISKEEFAKIVKNEVALRALDSVDVDCQALIDHADFFFQSDAEGQHFDKKVDFDEFMEMALQLRSTNTASVRDIVELRRFMHSQNTGRNLLLDEMQARERIATQQREVLVDYMELLYEEHQGSAPGGPFHAECLGRGLAGC